MANTVKFKRGLDEAYRAAKEAGTLSTDTLYFTTDTHRLFLGEDEISTPIRVTGLDQGGVNYPSAYNDDSFATVTDEFKTGEVRLGSAATQNVLTLFGPGDYYMKEGHGNRYVPTAYAVKQLINDTGWLRFQGDEGRWWNPDENNFADNLEWLKNSYKDGTIVRWRGPDQVIPREYVSNPGYSGLADSDVNLHTGDFILLRKEPYTTTDPEDPTSTTTEYANKLLVIPAVAKDDVVTMITNAIAANDAMVFKGTIGDNDTPGTVHQSSMITPTSKAGETYKVIGTKVKIPASYNFDNVAVDCAPGDMIVFAGWFDTEGIYYATRPENTTTSPKVYYIPSADDVTGIKLAETVGESNLTGTNYTTGHIILGNAAGLQKTTALNDAHGNDNYIPTAKAVMDYTKGSWKLKGTVGVRHGDTENPDTGESYREWPEMVGTVSDMKTFVSEITPTAQDGDTYLVLQDYNLVTEYFNHYPDFDINVFKTSYMGQSVNVLLHFGDLIVYSELLGGWFIVRTQSKDYSVRARTIGQEQESGDNQPGSVNNNGDQTYLQFGSAANANVALEYNNRTNADWYVPSVKLTQPHKVTDWNKETTGPRFVYEDVQEYNSGNVANASNRPSIAPNEILMGWVYNMPLVPNNHIDEEGYQNRYIIRQEAWVKENTTNANKWVRLGIPDEDNISWSPWSYIQVAADLKSCNVLDTHKLGSNMIDLDKSGFTGVAAIIVNIPETIDLTDTDGHIGISSSDYENGFILHNGQQIQKIEAGRWIFAPENAGETWKYHIVGSFGGGGTVSIADPVYDLSSGATITLTNSDGATSTSTIGLFSPNHPDNMIDSDRHPGLVPAPGTGDRDSVLTGGGKWVHLTESLMGETVDWYLEPDNIIPTDGTTPQVDDTTTEYGSRYIKANVSGGVIEYYGTMFLTVDKDYIYTPVDENDTNTLYLRVRLQNKAYDQENPSAAPYYIYKTVKLLSNGDGITTLPKGTWIFKTGSRGWLYAELVGEFPTNNGKVTTLDKEYTNGNRGLNIQLKEDDTVASTVEVPVMVGTPSHGGGQGKTGLVPAPSYGDNTRFLRGDGVWSLPTLLPYATSGSSRSEIYYGETVQNVTIIDIKSETNLLANQYFIATFTDNYYLNDGDERIIFSNKSTATTVPIFPRYRGDNIKFLPKGTWMWVKVDGSQTYELVGTFGPEWEQVNNG